MPPALLQILLPREGRRSLRLWLPLFLLWPLAAVALLVILCVSVAWAAVEIASGRGWEKLAMGPRVVAVLIALRGLDVEVIEEGRPLRIRFL